MIRFIQVSKRYPNGHEALNNVSLDIKKGSMTFVTGHSGAGKSTLLKLVSLIERTTQGQIIIDGQNLNKVAQQRVPYFRRSMGIILQNPHLLYDRNVFDNVALPLIISGYQQQEIGRRVRAALDKVGMLTKEKYFPLSLSAGEQQRLSIARAVVNKPLVLLADEPTGNLDPTLASEIMRLFEQFNQIGVTVLIASHDLALIANLKHRALTLKDGRLMSGAENE